MKEIKERYNEVQLFNDIAGNLSNVTHSSLVAQAKVVREEALELVEAVDEQDATNILKETTDCLVVIFGFMQMLEEQGYDVVGAWKQVNANNLSKFTPSYDIAIASQECFRSVEVAVDIERNDDYNVYVLKDEQGKIRKPNGYTKPCVAMFTPKGA